MTVVVTWRWREARIDRISKTQSRQTALGLAISRKKSLLALQRSQLQQPNSSVPNHLAIAVLPLTVLPSIILSIIILPQPLCPKGFLPKSFCPNRFALRSMPSSFPLTFGSWLLGYDAILTLTH